MVVRSRLIAVAVGSVLILGASLAVAAVLTPGTGPVAPDVFSIGYSGTQTAFTGFPGTAFSTGGGSINGNALMQVVSDPSNHFCAGCLDFILQIDNNGTSTANITSVTVSGYSGFQTDVGYDSLSVGGTTECGPADQGYCNTSGLGALGTVSRDATGNLITFTFAGAGLAPTQSSVDFVVETNAQTSAGATLSVIGSDSSTAAGIGGIFSPSSSAPPPATPAPPTILLLGVGMLVLIPGYLFAKRSRPQAP